MPNAVIEIQPPVAELAKFKEQLSAAQFSRVNYGIVKRTVAKLKTRVSKAIRDQINVRKDYLDSKVISTSMNDNGLAPFGMVVIKGKRVPLMAFKNVRDNTPGGISVTVIKADGGRQIYQLRHAFITAVRSQAQIAQGMSLEDAHRGIFLRGKHLPTTGPNVGRLNKYGRPISRILPSGFTSKYVIEEQYGPNLLKLIDGPEVLGKIKFDAEAEMLKLALSQYSRFGISLPDSVPADTESDD